MKIDRQKLIVSHNTDIDLNENEFKKNLCKRSNFRQDLENKINLLIHELEETRKQSENDIDSHIELLRTKHCEEQTKIVSFALNLTFENGILKRKLDALLEDIVIQKKDIKHLLSKVEERQKKKCLLEKIINDKTLQKTQICNVLDSKKSIVCKLKKQLDEIEKFKYVLQQEISESENFFLPRDNDINTVTKDLASKECELNTYISVNNCLNEELVHVKNKIEKQRSVIEKEKKRKELSKLQIEATISVIRELYAPHSTSK